MKDVHKVSKKETQWPADHVERRSVESLIPYARNARTHSDEQVAQIAASIKEWGWTTPVLVDEDGQIIAGHGRVMAARKLGIEEIPVMVASGWSEAQRRAYVLADNQLAANAGWDMDLLKVELGDLGEAGFDLDLIGFSGDMLAGLLEEQTEGLTDADDVPEVPAEPVTVLGDVWTLGRHRIICGSSTEADTVAKLLGDVKPHLMVTDPPYGVEYDATWRVTSKVNSAGSIAKKGGAAGKVANDDKADWREAWALFPGDVAYVWHAGVFSPTVSESLVSCDFDLRALIVWAKNRMVISRGHYHHAHEPCWYAVRKKGTGHWSGDRKQTTLWQIDTPRKSETGHSTQKPVECMKRPIENNSSPGQAVYEPFSGSGTTIIAGEMTGRHVYAIELNPAYVDVAVKRWQEFTGQEAVHADSGKTFNEMSNAKHA
jgi:DNA modification methylase